MNLTATVTYRLIRSIDGGKGRITDAQVFTTLDDAVRSMLGLNQISDGVWGITSVVHHRPELV